MKLLNRAQPAAFETATAVFLLLALLAYASAQARAAATQTENPQKIYFVAATPVGLQAIHSYPASLYTLGRNHTLRLVQQFFKTGEHFSDFADDLHGTIYLAGRKGVYVLHENHPASADFVPLTNFDGSFCWGAVFGRGVRPAVQYCPSERVTRVDANPSSVRPRVGTGSWAAFKDLQYGGENGGPFQLGPPVAQLRGVDLVMPHVSPPNAVLATLPAKDGSSPKLRRHVWILASTDRYLVLWIVPRSMGAYGPTHTVGTAQQPFHADPLHVLVLDKQTHHWRSLELPTTVSTLTYAPVRLFGNWLVTTVMDWSPPTGKISAASLKRANEQRPPMYTAGPSISVAYETHFLHIRIPGQLAIWNLADGRKLTLNTGQQDSEVLLIEKNGTMLYRVNDAIYSTKIEGDRIGKPTLLTKTPNATGIHWAFPGKDRKVVAKSK